MKPPHQNRLGNRKPGGGGPRRPGGSGDGVSGDRPHGPRPHTGGPGGARMGEARFDDTKPGDQRPPAKAHPDRPREGGTVRRAAGHASAGSPRGAKTGDAQRRDERPGRPPGPQRPSGTDQHASGAGPGRSGPGPSHRTAEPPRTANRTDRQPPPARPDQRSSGHRSAPDAARAAEPVRGPDAPRGTVWLYGQHSVAAALANPARRLRRLLLTEDAEAALAARYRPPWPIAVERVERGRLDHLLGRDTVHQGAALLADLLATPALAQVLERPGPLIMLDQVSDPRNVGAILRSAQAFGAAGVIVQDRNAPDETGALAKAASGALETVPLLRAVNLARTLVALKAAGCWVVGLAAEGAPLSGPALSQRRVVLVLGSEGEGLRRLTRETCDELAGIAMPGSGGGLDSLNVSAAAAVALYELGRRG